MDHRPLNGALGDEQASVLLAAVEQQLTRYFASIARQVESIKVTNAEAIAHQQTANAEYQEALRAALEERLTVFAQHQHDRLCVVEEQMDAVAARPMPSMPSMPSVPGTMEPSPAPAVVDPEVLQGIAQQFLSKIDSTERQLVDRLLELEARISHEQGTRIAQLETTVGRIGTGFDDSLDAVSQRVLALDSKLYELTARVDRLNDELSRAGSAELDELRTNVRGAVSDASIARAELERIAATVSKQLDHHASRLAELESLRADEADVDAAVQVERLDELERQVLRLSSTARGGAGGPVAGGPVASGTIVVPVTPITVSTPAPVAVPAPTVAPDPVPAAAPAAAAESFELDPAVWATDVADTPSAPAAPTVATAPTVPTVPAVPTSRTVTAPPSMTLVPKLPSPRTVSGGESVSDELARLLAR